MEYEVLDTQTTQKTINLNEASAERVFNKETELIEFDKYKIKTLKSIYIENVTRKDLSKLSIKQSINNKLDGNSKIIEIFEINPDKNANDPKKCNIISKNANFPLKIRKKITSNHQSENISISRSNNDLIRSSTIKKEIKTETNTDNIDESYRNTNTKLKINKPTQNNNYLSHILCINCGELIMMDEVDDHTDICKEIKEDILTNDLCENNISKIDFKLEKLRENVKTLSRHYSRKSQDEVLLNTLYHYVIVSKSLSLNIQSKSELKKILKQINATIINFKASIQSLIIFERAKLIIKEKYHILKEWVEKNTSIKEDFIINPKEKVNEVINIENENDQNNNLIKTNLEKKTNYQTISNENNNNSNNINNIKSLTNKEVIKKVKLENKFVEEEDNPNTNRSIKLFDNNSNDINISYIDKCEDGFNRNFITKNLQSVNQNKNQNDDNNHSVKDNLNEDSIISKKNNPFFNNTILTKKVIDEINSNVDSEK